MKKGKFRLFGFDIVLRTETNTLYFINLTQTAGFEKRIGLSEVEQTFNRLYFFQQLLLWFLCDSAFN